jgi:hypothetical protein
VSNSPETKLKYDAGTVDALKKPACGPNGSHVVSRPLRKKAAVSSGPKSREETPKKGSSTKRQFVAALQNIE